MTAVFAPKPSLQLRGPDMRWPIGITIGFVVVVALDFTFAYLAFHSEEPTVASYQLEKR
jgi:hypothetical protein